MNRLGDALSPYLRQHADNPVHWQPWDDAALKQARDEDKPILLSVGYAACHWCHVMAHESFEDAQTAAVMNANFVCVKVDREERPDIDRIYQAAHYLFARRAGGWPLTMFLTPAGEPFFGGTYYPKDEGRGMPSFVFVMNKVMEAWRGKREDIHKQNAQLMPLLRSFDEHKTSEGKIGARPITAAADAYKQMLDSAHGGFSGAPKFPHAAETAFMIGEGVFAGDDAMLNGARHTLQKMAAGGIYDHLGGGFFRYSVDERWQIPHFEKMLSDNGLLLALYADGARLWQSEEMLQTAAGIAEWALSEMRANGGGFYSSLDADSEGGEGAFYVWDCKEAAALLTDDEGRVFASAFGLNAPPNFEGKQWHLAKCQTPQQTAQACALTPEQCQTQLQSAAQKLLAARAKRKRPDTDDKILTGWNALMIRGLARAGRLLNKRQWLDAAAESLSSIRAELRPQGRLHSVRRESMLGGAAFLDDGAFLLSAVLELLRADFSPELLAFAEELADEMLRHFEDETRGGFYFQAKDQKELIRRPKPVDDNATPSGNGVLVESLLTLWRLDGDNRWRDAAQKSLRAFYDAVCERPAGCASMLIALRAYLSPPPVVFLTGDSDECGKWRCELEGDLRAHVYILPREGLPPALQKPHPQNAKVAAHLCDDKSCRAPVTSLDEIKQALSDYDAR